MQNQKLKAFLVASVAMSFPVCMSNASGFNQGATARYAASAYVQAPLLRGPNTAVTKIRAVSSKPQYGTAAATSRYASTAISGQRIAHSTGAAAATSRYVPAAASGQRIIRQKSAVAATSRYVPAAVSGQKIVAGAAPVTSRYASRAPKPALSKIMSHQLDAAENVPPTHQRPVPEKTLSHHLETIEAAPQTQVQTYQQSPRLRTSANPLTPKSAPRTVLAQSAAAAQQVPSLRLASAYHLDEARIAVQPKPVISKQVLPQSARLQMPLAVASVPSVQPAPATLVNSTLVNSIDQSVSKARTQSTRLAIENLRIQEAEEGLVQAESQGKFRLNFDSAVGVGQFETDFNVIDRTESDTRLQRTARLNLSLPLYQGGRIKAQKDIAKVGIKSAHANFGAVASDVTQEAAIAHLNVIQNRELIKVYTHNVALLENQKTTVQSLVRAGENTVTDEALIDARLASIKVRLEQARARLTSSESNYKKLVGRPAPALMQSAGVGLPGTLAEVKALAQKNNSQVKVAQAQAETALHNIEVAKSFGRPSLSLQGVLRAAEDQSETIRRNSAAEVLLNLTVPLLSGGENKSRIRQASLAQSRAVLETHRLHSDLNERLEQLWADLKSAQRSKAPNLAQKVAAQKAYDAVIKQRNAGLATSLDVLSIEQTLIDADINLIQAQNVEDVSRFQLLGLMGVL